MDESAQNESVTNEAPTPKPTTPQPAKPKASKKPIIITGVVALVLIILVAGGIYLWQQGIVKGLNRDKDSLEAKVVSQSAQLKTLEKNNKDLSVKVNFLDKALKEATAAANIEFGELSFPSVKATHYTYDEAGVERSVLLVDVTTKNETDQTLFLSAFNFKLKDAQNKSYPFAGEGSFPLPTGRVLLFDQQMAPAETVTGTLAFNAPKLIKLFTLFYNAQKFTITVR